MKAMTGNFELRGGADERCVMKYRGLSDPSKASTAVSPRPRSCPHIAITPGSTTTKFATSDSTSRLLRPHYACRSELCERTTPGESWGTNRTTARIYRAAARGGSGNSPAVSDTHARVLAVWPSGRRRPGRPAAYWRGKQALHSTFLHCVVTVITAAQ